MERLTEKAWRNLDPWECCGQDKYCKRDCHEDGGCAKGCVVPKLYGKLAAYEDTGLEPADAIEELLAAVPHWISVEERLPRPFVSVLVNIPGENPFPTVKEAFLEKTGMWYSIGFRYEQKEVTHWCEMPEPPKEVER